VRKAEVRKVVDLINTGLASGKVKATVDKKTGAVAFGGLTEVERDDVTDACAYRLLMIHGSALARAAITRAEQFAGRSVSREAIAQGHHSHDGGASWHHGH
jgi:hypothetical protein